MSLRLADTEDDGGSICYLLSGAPCNLFQESTAFTLIVLGLVGVSVAAVVLKRPVHSIFVAGLVLLILSLAGLFASFSPYCNAYGATNTFSTTWGWPVMIAGTLLVLAAAIRCIALADWER